jgi:hypothetical protein
MPSAPTKSSKPQAQSAPLKNGNNLPSTEMLRSPPGIRPYERASADGFFLPACTRGQPTRPTIAKRGRLGSVNLGGQLIAQCQPPADLRLSTGIFVGTPLNARNACS